MNNIFHDYESDLQQKFDWICKVLEPLNFNMEEPLKRFNNQYWILDRDRNPVNVPHNIYVAWRQTIPFERSIVAKDWVNVAEISTVFIGMDANYSEKGKPWIFETLVFTDAGVDKGTKYSTWDEAVKGHRIFVQRMLELA